MTTPACIANQTPKSRLILMCAIPLIIFLGIIGVVVIHSVHIENMNSVVNQMATETTLASHEIDAFFMKKVTIIEQVETNAVFEQYFAALSMSSDYATNPLFPAVSAALDALQRVNENSFLTTWACSLRANVCFQSRKQNWVSGNDWKMQSRPWYPALKKGQTSITSPYISAIDGERVISIVLPILDRRTGKVHGAVGADISTEGLPQSIQMCYPASRDHIALFAPDGTIIAHSNGDYYLKNIRETTYSTAIQQAITNQKSGQHTYTLGGNTMIGYLAPVGNSDWMVLSERSENTISSLASHTGHRVSYFFAGTLLVLICLLLLLYQTLRKLENHKAFLEKEVAQRTENLTQQSAVQQTVNDIAQKLLAYTKDQCFAALVQTCLRLLGEASGRSRVYIWQKIVNAEGRACLVHTYEWNKDQKASRLRKVPFENMPSLERTLAWGGCLNSLTENLAPAERGMLEPLGILSILIAPISINGHSWGLIGINNYENKELFSPLEENLLQMGGFLLARAIQRRADQELMHEAEELTQSILDAMPLGCLLVDVEGKALICNQSAVSLFRFSSKEEFLEHFQDLSPEYQPNGCKSSDSMLEKLNESSTHGHARFEWMHQMRDGEPMPLEITLVRIKYKDSYATAVYAQDLREAKAQETKMREAEERTQLMLNATPLCCNLWDEYLDNIACNDEAVRLFDLSSQQEYLERFAELSPEHQPDGRLSSESAQDKILKAFTEGYCRFEWMHQHLNGDPIPAEITLVRVAYKNSYIVAGYTRDLRETKAQEEQMREAEERTQLMLNAMPLCCNLWDTDLSNTDCNDEAVRLFELSSQQEYLDRFAELSPEYQADGRLSIESIREKILHAFTEGYCRFEWMHQNLKGDPIPAEITMVRAAYKNTYIVTGYTRDLREARTLAEVQKVEAELALARDTAIANSKAKSEILAKVSHEIRTPMNAVIGMCELILRDPLPPSTREHALHIKQASGNLLFLINDILDFAKIEAGKLEIIENDYVLPALISNVISIARIRAFDSPLQLVTEISPDLPHDLVGDETRIRQIILNLLSNAIKYTNTGHVALHMSGESLGPDTVLVKIAVSDTGIGIKAEDLPHLFGEFVQLDTKINKDVESTGLGLTITKHLCQAMGGDITASSVYGQGSVFTVTLPQKFVGSSKLAFVPNPQDFRVLLYEPRTLYATSLCATLEKLGVSSTLVANQSKLFEAFHEGYSHIFLPSFLFETCYNELKRLNILENTVVCAEYGEKMRHNNVNVVSIPLHTFTIANILNKNMDFSYEEGPKPQARFIAPSAKVLVVDDIRTNLKVAEGLMSSYGMQVDTCESGEEAIALVQSASYDLVFMDHMMPGMDGIETTQNIRALPSCNELPIIALTANAVKGAKEMFLENGFDDFLAKPVEMISLNETLERWIPKKKQQKVVAVDKPVVAPTFEIAGVDTRYGIAMTGGSESNYLRVLTTFYMDGTNKLNEISQSLAAEDLPLYATYTHALKSALGSIGALYLSGCAAKLELAGKNFDKTYIEGANEIFLQDLMILLDNISAVITLNAEPATDALSEENFCKQLILLKKALTDMNAVAMDKILGDLQTGALVQARAVPLERLMQYVLLCDYDEAETLITELLEQASSAQASSA